MDAALTGYSTTDKPHYVKGYKMDASRIASPSDIEVEWLPIGDGGEYAHGVETYTTPTATWQWEGEDVWRDLHMCDAQAAEHLTLLAIAYSDKMPPGFMPKDEYDERRTRTNPWHIVDGFRDSVSSWYGRYERRVANTVQTFAARRTMMRATAVITNEVDEWDNLGKWHKGVWSSKQRAKWYTPNGIYIGGGKIGSCGWHEADYAPWIKGMQGDESIHWGCEVERALGHLWHAGYIKEKERTEDYPYADAVFKLWNISDYTPLNNR
jgi:hypothetical protein